MDETKPCDQIAGKPGVAEKLSDGRCRLSFFDFRVRNCMVRYAGDIILSSGNPLFCCFFQPFVGMRREGKLSVCRRVFIGIGSDIVVCRKNAAARIADRTGGMAGGELVWNLDAAIRQAAGIQATIAGNFRNHGSSFFPDIIFQQFFLGYAAWRTDKRVFLSGLSDNGAGCNLFLCTEGADAGADGVSGPAKRTFGAGVS